MNKSNFPNDKKPSVDEVLNKYSGKIEKQINNSSNSNSENSQKYSGSYMKFKNEMSPQFSKYEKWCHSLGSFVKMKISEEKEKKIQRYLNIAHLDIQPWQAYTLSVMGFIMVFMLGLIISFSIMLIRGGFPFMLFFLSMISSIFLFYYLNGIPERLANKWRLKASSQMVPAILYIVVYMRHTPNLEKAISFAAQHLQEPLSLDLKKVFYDVEIGKFSSIKESLNNYLNIWKDYSSEFIEGFHLIESSLFEPDENRRIATLEKSLQVVLDGVYDNMLKFVHNVKSPLQNTYMLGTTLPVLGLALLPLASAMVGEYLQASHVFILYNLLIPFIAFFLMNKFLLMRPGGYGETNLLERNRYYKNYTSKKPYWKAFFICFPLLLIGLLPLIFGYTPVPNWIGIERDYTFGNIGLSFIGEEQIFGFISEGFSGSIRGPYGIGSLIMGMFFPLGIALYFSLVFKFKTKELIKERNSTRKLEAEFNNSLFQLGSRIGNGTPPELVFSRAIESSQGLKTEDFFKRVNYNIRQLGMNVERAIFDSKRGAINYYPSDLISTSMRILVESSKKGLKIASTSLMSISQYVKNIRKITDRLKDMLAEVVSDMKSNMTFLAPLLSGIVVGLAGMISAILLKLENLMESASSGSTGIGGVGTISDIFKAEQMIPPYFLQIAIGIYLIQIVFILTSSLVTIDSGEDRLTRTYEIGRNLKTGMLFYFITAFIASIVLFVLASVVLGGL
ncbi:MAG: hypothetical protein ACOCUU_01445 [Nanoarchaeota archaeon]